MMSFPAVRAGAAAALLLAAAGCATQSAVSGAAPRSSPAASATLTSAGTPTSPGTAASAAVPTSIVGTAFLNPALTAVGGALYLRWDLKQQQQSPPPEGFARVDPATGRILAANSSLPGSTGTPAYAVGSLWVTDSTAGGEFLLRLNPRTLALTGQLRLASGNYPVGAIGGSGSHIAFAGGLLWADGAASLVAVSPSTMKVRQTITFPHANSSDAMASADGSTLIVSEAVDGVGAVQRRDPVTGALLASVPMSGVVAPILGAVTAGGTWISEPTGMMGYIERLDTTTLAADLTTMLEGSNGIRVNLWDGELWVTNEGGGPSRNYCADPATGHRLATSPHPDLGQDYLMTVAGGRVYYSVPAGNRFRIHTVPAPAACG